MLDQSPRRAGHVTKLVVGLVALGVCSALAMLTTLALVPNLVGWRTDVVVSGSMAPRIQVGDAIVAQPYRGQRLRVGAVAVFRDTAGHRVSHRVVALHRDGTYATRGDANPQPDSTPLAPERIIGVGRMVVPRVGAPVVWAQSRQWFKVALLAAALGVLVGAARWSFATGAPRAPRSRVRSFRPRLTRQAAVRAVAVAIAVELSLALAVVPSRAHAAFVATTANPASNFVAANSWGIRTDSVSSAASAGAVSTISWAHTVGAGSARVLVVAMSLRRNGVVANVSYGGVGGFVHAGTELGSANDHTVDIWYKVAPPIGTANVQVTMSGGAVTEMVGAAMSLTGVNQLAPTGLFVATTGADATPTITVSSAPGEFVLGVLSNSGNTGSAADGSGQTQRWATVTGFSNANEFGAGSTKPGAASVTLSWAMGRTNKWALGAIALKPA
jgi:signal peptidase I